MGSQGFCVRTLAPIDLLAWGELAAQHGCFFDSLRWTDLYGSSLRRMGLYDAGGNLRGGFCFLEERRWGLRVFRNPPYSPQIGPFYEPRATNPAARNDEQRAVIEAMAEFLVSRGATVTSLGLAQGVTDCLPFYWRGWKVVPHYTYRIDLGQDSGAMLAAMSTERRKNVRKSSADGVIVREVTDTSEMCALVEQTYARQRMSFASDLMNLIFSEFPPGRQSFCQIARVNDRPIAGVYIVHDRRTAYYLIGGYADGAHHGAGALAMWNAILQARKMGLEYFDFEGSMVPPIERYFRGFGGQLTPIFSVHKAWLPIETVLNMHFKYRNRF